MEVTKISANVRYSQDTGHGAWKVIELGAEASLDFMDADWQSAQRELYDELTLQLRQLWNCGKAVAINSAETAIEAPFEEAPVPNSPEVEKTAADHWCAAHGAAYTRKTGKGGASWYSHKAPDGSWCREV